MLELPKKVGATEDGKEIVAGIGRFGPYVRAGSVFASIAGRSPHEIKEAEARQLIKEQTEKKANREIKSFAKVRILRGPYGPYVSDGKKNAKIPKDIDPEKMSEKEAEELLAKAPAKKKFRRRKTKKE